MASLSASAYKKLLTDLRRLLTKAASHKPMAQHVLQSHWSVGRRLVQEQLLDGSSYGEVVVKRLSEELEIDWNTLYRAIRFASEYEELPGTGLSWAHYRELLTLSDLDERAFYEEMATTEGLSRDRLIAAMKAQLYSSKSKKGGVKLKRPTEARYLYEVQLSRVVDGDTLLVTLDLGFGILKEQRVRLVSVDALSANSKKGKDATFYVAQRLDRADRILVQTQRADLHGRFLAHVFYSTRSLGFLETFESGHYLNQQLIDQKLAVPRKC